MLLPKRVDFRCDDSTLQETIRDQQCKSTRIATISHSRLLHTANRLPVKRFNVVRTDLRRIVRIDSNHNKFKPPVIAIFRLFV